MRNNALIPAIIFYGSSLLFAVVGLGVYDTTQKEQGKTNSKDQKGRNSSRDWRHLPTACFETSDDLHGFFSLEKFRIWYQNLQCIPDFLDPLHHLRKMHSLNDLFSRLTVMTAPSTKSKFSHSVYQHFRIFSLFEYIFLSFMDRVIKKSNKFSSISQESIIL